MWQVWNPGWGVSSLESPIDFEQVEMLKLGWNCLKQVWNSGWGVSSLESPIALALTKKCIWHNRSWICSLYLKSNSQTYSRISQGCKAVVDVVDVSEQK